MAQPKLVYYFTLTSPWAYLGHQIFVDMAGRYGLQIDYRPIGLGQIFPATGGLPLAKRAPARQAYRQVELQRWRVRRGIPVNLHAKFFPFDVGLADRTLIALLETRASVDDFILRTLAAVFVQDRNMADRAEIALVLKQGGLDAGTLLARAEAPEIAEQYQANNRAALADGVFGSPAYLLNGEVFWGQDRLDLLEEALSSGRSPYKPA